MSFALALLAAGFYGSGDFLGGLAARRARVLPVTFVSQGVGLAALVVLAPLAAERAPAHLDLIWGAAAGLCGATAIAFLYYGLAIGSVSVVAPISAVVGLALPVVVGVALGDTLSAFAAAGIGLAAVSIVLISREPGDGADRPRHGDQARQPPPASGQWSALAIAMLSGVFIGAFLVCLSRAPRDGGLWPLLASRAVSVAGLGLAISWKGDPLLPVAAARPAALASGLLDVVATVCFLAAVRTGMLSLVATLTNLYPAATVVLARVVLRERLRPVQLIGMALALAAIVLIAR